MNRIHCNRKKNASKNIMKNVKENKRKKNNSLKPLRFENEKPTMNYFNIKLN